MITTFQLGCEDEIKISNEFYLNLAINQAWFFQGLTFPNPAVGALILNKYGKILSIASHKEAGKPHAEVLAIQEAFFKITNNHEILNLHDSLKIHEYLTKNHNNIFQDCIIFTTLEPCNHFGKTPPCSLLIKNLGFKKVVIGTRDTNPEAEGGFNFLKENNIDVEILNSKEAKNLIEPFRLWQKKRFVLFKYAQTLNGKIDGGIISSENSRKFVHKLRNKVDLLMIGGETVRTDKPILDSRLINGKAPDVFIFSNQKNFDKNIPLFKVPNRKVTISNSLNILDNYKFILVEGGFNLLNNIIDEVDWLLIFISPKIASTKIYQLQTLNFEIIYQQKLKNDLLIWLKKVS